MTGLTEMKAAYRELSLAQFAHSHGDATADQVRAAERAFESAEKVVDDAAFASLVRSVAVLT